MRSASCISGVAGAGEGTFVVGAFGVSVAVVGIWGTLIDVYKEEKHIRRYLSESLTKFGKDESMAVTISHQMFLISR